MAEYLTKFPSGPLDKYRQLASFDWKRLKVFLETEEALEFKYRLYNELQKHAEWFEEKPQTLDEIRRTTVQKMFVLKKMEKTILKETDGNVVKTLAFMEVLYPFDANAYVKFGLTFKMFPGVIKSMGTKRHESLFQSSEDGDIFGCFCLTEIGHGSNTKGIQTTATYDLSTKQFILHTPNFEAAKCWAGNLGKTATHAIIYAQLITPDGAKHGLHAFVVAIRDPKTLLPYTGLKICDMGEKIGLNGFDNGYIMFDQYYIPRENLLNRIGDVSENGRYVTAYQDPNKRHGASLGTLSEGRVGITGACAINLCTAVTIAIHATQLSVNNFLQTMQHRLIPYLAQAYAFSIFYRYLSQEHFNFLTLLLHTNGKDASLPAKGLEIHAISSASKPLVGWYARDGIQECREACAGHGYLKAAGLGDLRNTHDPNCTYEGDNHVLMQQTSNWLLKLWPLIMKGTTISTPLNSVAFLNEAQQILTWTFSANTIEEISKPETILNAFQWLICYLLKSSYDKFKRLASDANLNNNAFWAKNNSQVFYAKDLAVVYIQHFILQKMHEKILSVGDDTQIKKVLMQLFALCGIFFLEKHIPILYVGGYASGPDLVDLIHESILKLCGSLKNDAVALVDVLALPDFALNSVLGYSDGEVYKHLEASMMRTPGALSRPHWWKEIAFWNRNIQSKL